MSDTRVSDIVTIVEEERAAGRDPDVVALCGGDAALAAAVGERLRELAGYDAFVRPRRAEPPAALPPGYELLGVLGRGGMGVVYKARAPGGAVVAVKTLTHLDPTRLVYLKQEFAALVGVRHDNLVAVYAQTEDGGNWFCVMEYVDGEHFLNHVRGGAWTRETTAAGESLRLRPALAQLATGVRALHRIRKLHRDIKSSNVLVTGDGKVKLLDFGLVADLDRPGERPSGPVGTFDWMSPEQFASKPLTPACDWYSFGTLMYAALCGRMPFAGNLMTVMRAKEAGPPPPPSQFAPGVPPDLEALCVELLNPDPAARPDGDEVLRRLGTAVPPPRAPAPDRPPLFGREEHLARLRDASADARRTGRPVVVKVHGPSGVGKTAVVERFLQDLRDGGTAVALAGRCYEQSSVPYKALDGLVDDLLRFLRRLTREQVEAVLPVRVADLARLFPVLRRLEAVAELPPPADPDDPHEARRRGFGAFRELCHRIAAKRPLVLFADDLQWGDQESAALLEELVRPPDAPPLLFVAGYRRRDADVNPFVTALHRLPVERREVTVDPLTEDDARALAEALLGQAPEADRTAALIARESAGSPLLVQQLVEFHLAQPDSTAPPTTDAVIRARVARLQDEPRRLAEVVVLAVGPVAVEAALRAAEIPPDRQAAALDVLVAGLSLRTAGGGDAPRTVEPFHDRVRETIAADLTADVRAARHRRLAVVLAAAGGADPEALAHHYEQAGEPGRAADFYAAAGRESAAALAFDRAADQFRRALDLCGPADPRRTGLMLARAEALASATHGVEAAAAYAAAAERCGGVEAITCRQRAAEQLIWAGRVGEGEDALRAVLAAAGIAPPAAGPPLLRSLAWLRARLWVRGFRFKPRPAGLASADARLRVDICRWAAGQVRMFDVPLGTWLHTRGLLLALAEGDPAGAALGLGREAFIRPVLGRSTPRRIGRVVGLARAAAAGITDPADRAFAGGMIGLYEMIGRSLVGDFRAAAAAYPAADEALRACSGPRVAYERPVLRVFDALSRLMLGDLSPTRALCADGLSGMAGRGNLHAVVSFPLLGRAHTVDLADGRPEAARERVRSAIAQWGGKPTHLQHVWAWLDEIDVWLYEGRAAGVWAACRAGEPAGLRLVLLDNVTVVYVHWTRGRAAVAAAAAGDTRALADATRAARALERNYGPFLAPPLGWLLRATTTRMRGETAAAVGLLARAEEEFTKQGLAFHAAAAGFRRGRIEGGAEGDARAAAALATLRAAGVQNPERFIDVFAPGFRENSEPNGRIAPPRSLGR